VTEPIPSAEALDVPVLVRPPRLYRRAYTILRSQRRALLLPFLVLQAPLAITAGLAQFFVLFHFYPDVPADSFEPLRTGPDGLRLSLATIQAVWLLFAAVGLAATVFATNAVIAGRVPKLAESLDPAFTRMGGLFALGALFYLMFAFTVVGVVLLPYFIVRFGFAFHALMLENVGIRASLRRSWSLLRRRMFRFVRSLTFPALLATGAFLLGVFVFSIVAIPFVSVDAGRTETLALTSFAIAALGIVAVPCSAYFAIATTILYLDFRSAENA